MTLSEESLKMYWSTLPIGKENAVDYPALIIKWKCGHRTVRAILNLLSRYDSGDNYILIRSSKGRGFYRTDKIEEIEAFRRECLSRGRSCLAPVKKMNRVLDIKYKGDFDLFTALEQTEAL